VTCASCGAQNDPGRKFCLECGTPLAAVCASCGAANQAAAKFCGECGGRLGSARPGAIPPGAVPGAQPGSPTTAAASGAAVAERRLVSVLFADLVGFTTLAEHRDAEEVRELLSRYFDLARGIVEGHGGTVEKFIGDAVMAVWGTPTSHEDDAERAVRAALELVAAVRGLGPSVEARAGILTGEAAVTIGAVGEGMVAGDMVNTASRLQAAAPPGIVLVGETTMNAASRAIAFDEAGEQLLKGKAAPVAAWRALRVVAERGGRGRSASLEAPFVGRDDELRLLKDLYHATTRDRRVRLVSVTGQGGIGKSRLAWEFLKYIDGLVETVYWHQGRSPSYGSGITFWALGEMVRERAGLAEADDEATTRDRIAATAARWVPDAHERRWIEQSLLALLGVGDPPAGGQDQLFSAWRTLFERIAAEAPVVMVFEDLQWADSGLLAFVDHLVEWSRGVPIYVVALARPELLETRPDWGAGKRNFTSLALEPLTSAAMHELLAGLVPGLPEDAAARIVARADGVPLYAVEIVRMLVAQGALEAAGDAYRPVGDLADLAVPETLHSLIAARLDALDPADRALLQAAAVLGHSFTVDGLAAVASSDPGDAERRLVALARRELVIRDLDPRSTERGQFAFVQSLVREVAYSTLARRDRKARHLAAARHFETLVDQELAGALATHYLAAYRNATEGPEADALAGQARIALRAAGDRAVALGAQEQALGFYRDALEVTSEPQERAALLEQSGISASAAGLHEDAERLLGEAIDLLRAAGDRSGAARVTGFLGDAMFGRYRLDAALALVEPASAEFADLGDDPGLATLLGQLARFQMLRQVDFGAAIANADRTLAIAERLDRVDLVADTLVTRGVALVSVGRAYEGIGCLETGLRLAQQHGLLATEIRARINLGGPLMDRDPRAAFDISRVGLEQVRRFGHRQGESMLIVNTSAGAVETGQWDWAREQIGAGLEAATGEEERALLLGLLVELRVQGGESADAELDEAGAWLAAHVADEPYLESSIATNDAARAELRGDLATAAARFLDAGRLDPYNAVWSSSEAAVVALVSRDRELASACADALRATGSHAAIARLTLRVANAGIVALDGRPDAARGPLLAAYGELRDLGAARRQALTGLVMATLLGDGDARVHAAIAESRRLFEQMSAGFWLSLLDAASAALPGRAPTPAPSPAGAADTAVAGAEV
jgi:class 3 adenylate cyclase/tetratricopeptide (TPR) repeat protein